LERDAPFRRTGQKGEGFHALRGFADRTSLGDAAGEKEALLYLIQRKRGGGHQGREGEKEHSSIEGRGGKFTLNSRFVRVDLTVNNSLLSEKP